MTDFRKIAEGIDPRIEVDKILPVMEDLEKAFTPLVKTIPAGADVWSGPEDGE